MDKRALAKYDHHGAHGVMFHHFHGGTHIASQGSLSAEGFARMLDFLGGQATLLPAEEWMDKALAGRLGDGEVCLTFDDALKCQYDIAVPVMQRLGLTAFFFVYSSVLDGNVERLELYRHFRHACFADIEAFYAAFDDALAASRHGAGAAAALTSFKPSEYLAEHACYTASDRRFRFIRDRILGPAAYYDIVDAMMEAAAFDTAAAVRSLWMVPDDVRRLAAAGHVIGLHSYSHPTTLADLPPTEQRREYARNKEQVEAMTGTPVKAMSHPCNSYSPDTLAILSGLGIRLGFRANMARPLAGGLEHPREDHANVARLMEMRP